MNETNLVYKLIIALDQVNGIIEVEYYTNELIAQQRSKFKESKGFKTLIMKEINPVNFFKNKSHYVTVN